MKTQHSHSAILFPLLANAASLHSLFLFFARLRTPVSDHAGMLIWWGCLTLTYIILTVLLRHPRSLQPVILTAAAGLVLQLVLTLLFALRPSTILSCLVLFAMWAALFVRCCSQMLEGTSAESVTTTFEASVLMLFVTAFGISASAMTPSSLFHTAAGTLLALIAMARIRSGHARVDAQTLHPQKGRFLLVGVLAALGGVAAAFCVLLTDSAAQLLSAITQWGLSLLRAIWNLIDRLLRWLLSLLPDQEIDPALMAEAEAQAAGGDAEWGTVNTQLPLYLMIGALTALTLAALIWIWRNGGFHRVAFRSRTTVQTTRRCRSLRSILQELRQRLSRWISFRITYLKQRNTAPGLFVWLERQMQSRHLERKPWETPRAFLLRIQESLPACKEPLACLADCLDQHYFGSGQTISAADITAMRKQLQTELHRKENEP